MLQHQRRKHMPVSRSKAMHIMAVEPVALQSLVEKILVLIEMARVGGVHDLQLAHGVAKPGDFQFLFDISIAPHHQGAPQAGALIGDGGAQDARIIALGKDHPGLGLTGAGMNPLQDARRRVHAGLEGLLIGLEVNDRAARHPGIHTRLGHRRRHNIDQPGVKRRGNDVVAPERQLAAIGHCNLIRHIFARQGGKGAGAGDLHVVVDRPGVDVKRAPEEIGKAQNVVDLIGIVTAPGGHDGIGADSVGLFRGDFRIGVCHGEDHRIVRH